jgi:hypothetical protein
MFFWLSAQRVLNFNDSTGDKTSAQATKNKQYSNETIDATDVVPDIGDSLRAWFNRSPR